MFRTLDMVGESPGMRRVWAAIEAVAPTDATVLLLGETGTGKQLAAQAIHDLSQRKNKPFIHLNCAGMAPGVIESELFGHEKGAFTGALSSRKGRFELADGGTIFLDEMAELPAELQGKLLRVLEECQYERVGGNRTLRADARVIAATNRNLHGAVRAGDFRSDLYYRLNVFPVILPPLRERKSDIPLLVQYCLTRTYRKLDKHLPTLSRSSMELLMRYDWPGNVRELFHLIERAAILSRGPVLEIEFPPISDQTGGQAAGPSDKLEDLDRAHILRVLYQTGWVIDGPNGAAGRLGLHPNTLRHRLQKLGIRRPVRRPVT